VVQLEYQFISSFALSGELLDLTPYGAADIADDYVPWVWKQGVAGDQVLAIPQDSGPLGNLYREDILTAAGVTEPPATWADYKTAAEAVRANTSSYISNMAPNQGAGWLGLLWQAGVKPFAYDGDKGVTIDVNSPEAKEVMAYWQDLIQNDLVSTDADFTDEWYQGLNQGKYAGWLTAAWAPVFLSGAAADTSGLWRAAPLPQWNAGDEASGNWGGSADAVLKTSKNPIAAYELAKWINNAQEPALLFATQQHFFPTAISVLQDPEFVDQEPDFYGGQKVNSLFADISETVDTDWQWLPFMEFAYTSFNETFGAAVAAKGDLGAGLDAWQDALVDYGTQQGFTVNG
jgi:multiple sugar transport system substrate-binding protein